MEQKKSIRRPISTGLIGHLHGLYARYGLDEETRRGMILDLTKGRTDSTRDLTYSEGQYLSGYIQGAAHENRDLSYGRPVAGGRQLAVGTPHPLFPRQRP